MRRSKVLVGLAAVVCCCCIGAGQSGGKLPAVKIIATGGTIAGEAATSAQSGYTSGQVGVDALIKAVPTLNKVARVSGEQISNVGSQDMSDEIWLETRQADQSAHRLCRMSTASPSLTAPTRWRRPPTSSTSS